jgi:uncharacterized protein
MVKIELVYIADDTPPLHLKMDLPSGTTVGGALSISKIHHTHPETTVLAVGIYTKIVPLDKVLRDGDRIELYRPLALDPKEKRRQLARVKNKSR